MAAKSIWTGPGMRPVTRPMATPRATARRCRCQRRGCDSTGAHHWSQRCSRMLSGVGSLSLSLRRIMSARLRGGALGDSSVAAPSSDPVRPRAFTRAPLRRLLPGRHRRAAAGGGAAGYPPRRPCRGAPARDAARAARGRPRGPGGGGGPPGRSRPGGMARAVAPGRRVAARLGRHGTSRSRASSRAFRRPASAERGSCSIPAPSRRAPRCRRACRSPGTAPAARRRAGPLAPPDIRAGERWRFTVRLKRPRGLANPHGFDFEPWALARGIRATGYVRAAPAPVRLAANEPGWPQSLHRLRGDIRDAMRASLGEARFAGVLVALAIGDQDAIARPRLGGVLAHRRGPPGEHFRAARHDAREPRVRARGVRVGARAARWRSPVPARKAGAVAGVAAATAYTLLAGFGVPAQRTLVMLSAAAACLLADRQASPSRVFAAAALAVLAPRSLGGAVARLLAFLRRRGRDLLRVRPAHPRRRARCAARWRRRWPSRSRCGRSSSRSSGKSRSSRPWPTPSRFRS